MRGSRGAALAASAGEAVHELAPAVRRELEAGRAGVAAVANEQVRARLERRAEVERAVAATRRADHVSQLGPDDRRPAAVLREACGDEPDDPDGPRTVDERGRRIGGALEQRPRLGDGRLHEVPPRRVGGLECLGTLGRLGRILGQQQAGRLRGLPHPPGGVEPWGDRERDRFEVHRIRPRARNAPAVRPARGAARAASRRARAGRSHGSRRRSGRRRRPCRSSRGRPVPAPPRGLPAPPSRIRQASLNATPLPASRRSG